MNGVRRLTVDELVRHEDSYYEFPRLHYNRYSKEDI